MSIPIEPVSAPISTSRALGLGLRQAFSLWPAALAVFGSGALEVLGGAVVSLGLVTWALGSPQAGGAALGGAMATWLLAGAMRALFEGAALRQGTERMLGRGYLPLAAEAVRAAPRALSFFLWSFPLEFLRSAWLMVGLVATFSAYVGALGGGESGVLASAALALFFTLWLPVSLGFSVWLKVGFVRAIRRDEGVLASLFEAAGELWRRPGARVLILLATGAAAFFSQLVLGGMINTVPTPDEPSLTLALAGQVASGLLVAYALAVIGLVQLQALLAVELHDEGSLAGPPPPARVLDAQVIIEAQPVSPESAAPPSLAAPLPGT